MNEKRSIAGAILDISKKAVTTERGQQHGDAQASFEAIGQMWATYINATQMRRTGIPLASLHISAADVAFMMVQMKQMRVLYGDETDPDNYVDAAGYTALAGMFAVPARRVAPASGEAPTAPEQPPEPPIPAFLSDGYGPYYNFPASGGMEVVQFHRDEAEGLPLLPEGAKYPYKGGYTINVGDDWPSEGKWEFTHRLTRGEGEKPAFLLKPVVEAK